MRYLPPLLLLFATFSFAEPERPDIILIMVDDMGFSDLGYMGGDVETPNLDALAGDGVRFSQFYNAGRCCPTRATLMTGLHPHQTGIGHMTNPPNSSSHDLGVHGYRGFLNRECVTIAEVLRENGYATLMTGKWHLGQNDQELWPLQRGFEQYYGCITGATRFFHPEQPRGMTMGNKPIETPESTTDEAFYTTDAFTDHAIRFLQEEEKGDDRPKFLYLAYTAPHWPLQAFEDDIAKYRGTFREGWDAMRERRYQRQIRSGLIDEKWPLSPRTPEIPDWDSLDEKTRDEMDLKMAVYSAMIDRVDQNIGKLVDHLKKSGSYADTLIFFLSDNGGCQEGGMLGRGEFYDIERRNLQTSNSYGEAWANASNTPFRLYKHYVHEGGAATPFFMHWPAKIEKQAEWYSEPAQLIDVMPTILDVAGAEYPEKAHGNDMPELDGVSLRSAFASGSLGREKPIFLEHEDNAAVREGDWKLVGKGVSPHTGVDPEKWELYNIAEDRTETNDLSDKNPGKRKELSAKWDEWANRVGVYPKKSDGPKSEPEPLQVKGRAFSITATVRSPKPSGVAISHGGVQFGYALHFQEGKPVFSIRDAGKLTELVAEKPIKGKATVSATLNAETMSISVDGRVVARRKSPGLMTGQPAIGMYLGQDFKDAVGSYKVPHKFNGRILDHKAEVTIPKVAMRTKWAEQVNAENVWQEYPRPQMKRKNWTNLNGNWNYAITGKDRREPPAQWDGEILVPFAIEAPLSGVEKRFTPDDALWYERTFESEKKDGKRYLLNFEAVDYESTVWVNGAEVGSNTGGNLPFSFDITDALDEGQSTVTVRVTDATDSAYQLHGKQRLNPKGIWYTPVSGIWQTVWMEEVPDTYLSHIKITPKVSGRVEVELFSEGGGRANAVARVKFGDVDIASAKAKGDKINLSIPSPRYWLPDKPNLYDLEIQFGDDLVQSYFGIRETGIEADGDGHLRFTINGSPIFHWGTLDQGWWPDGLLTPPSDEAMVSDIEFLKAAGFNTIRKHIKVEPRRYYYHCDRIGMLVWQDQVSAKRNDDPEWTRLQPNPEKGVWPDDAHRQYMRELEEMMDLLHSHPSIVQWVPFNERWGQHHTEDVGKWTVEYDPSRQVNVASGGNFFPVGHIVDAHHYPHPEFPWGDGEGGRFSEFVKVMGEFGGHGFPVENHVWDTNARNWGYGGLPKDKEEWLDRYRTSIERLTDLKKKGIAAGIYTQTTDVEGEINGLITYDREVQKIAPETLREISKELTD